MIFINYRKDDTQPIVDHLAVRLKEHFGPAAVFMDDKDLQGGDRWRDLLRQKVLGCDVLLAVIGALWLKIPDKHGRRRLDDPEDWVRQEICTALEHGKRVIVLLVDVDSPPPRAGLPGGCLLEQLPDLQALPLRTGRDFDADVARLIDHLSAFRTRRDGATSGGAAARPLPPCPPVFFGRDADRDRLVEILAPADPAAAVPATPVGGIGGIGKSTLVLRALYHPRVAARYGERRHFVRLDAAASRAAVVAALAEAVGLPLGDALEDRLLQLLSSGAPRLLVLDNAETPLLAEDGLESEALLQQLTNIATLAVVATLRGVCPLGPGWRRPIELRRLDEDAARDTFLAGTSGLFSDDPALADLVRELDGWPLAVAILAHQARYVADLGELAELWRRKRTALLSKGVKKRDADIATCMELSLGSPQMTADARRLLSLLGILPDGIRRADLPELLPPEGIAAAAALRRVGGLAFDDGPRLRVLASVREYLAANHPPSAEDRERAVRFYCDVADRQGNKAGSDGGAEAMDRVAGEVGNLVAMVRLGLQGGDPEPAFKGAIGLGEFSRFSGVDLSATLAEAEQVARGRGNTRREADCINRLGDIALYRSEHAKAREAYERALPLYERVGDLLGQANCVRSLGHLALARSEHGEARRAYERALPLYERVGDLLGQANCVRSLGHLALARSEHGEARRAYERALPLYERVGDLLGQANCIQSLGDIALARSEHAAAREAYERALPLYERVGALLGQANCIKRLGDIALARSEHAAARGAYERALPLYERVGALLGQANCIQSLGDISREKGDLPKAKECYEQAQALYERYGDPYSLGRIHRLLARITTDAERQRHVQAARGAWTRIDRPDLVAQLDREFGPGG